VKVEVGPGTKAMMKEMDRHKAAMEKIHEERLKPDVKLDKISKMIKTEVARTIAESEKIRKKYPEEAGRNAAKRVRQARMSDEARELKLFIENDGDLYRQQGQPILKNLTVKKAQGKYDSAKAVKLYMYLMDNGAKKYFKQFGSPGMKWMDMFPKKARLEAAKEFVEEFEEAFDDGEYDEYIPKKYRKKDADVQAAEGSDPQQALASLGGLLNPLKSKGWKVKIGKPGGHTEMISIGADYRIKARPSAKIYLTLRAYKSGSKWAAQLNGAWPKEWDVKGVRTEASDPGWGKMTEGLIDLVPIKFFWPDHKKQAAGELKKTVAALAKATKQVEASAGGVEGAQAKLDDSSVIKLIREIQKLNLPGVSVAGLQATNKAQGKPGVESALFQIEFNLKSQSSKDKLRAIAKKYGVGNY
jgi:hypothetical protein